MTYWTQHDLTLTDDGKFLGAERMSDWYREAALRAIAETPEGFSYHPATLNGGYTALNCLPCVLGSRWVVSEEMYEDQKGFLPPLRLPAECVSQPFVKNSGFAISEYSTGSIRSAY